MSLRIYSRRFQALGGENEIQLFADSESIAEHAFERCCDEVLRIHNKYSRYLPNSVLSCINRQAFSQAGVSVDAESAALIDFAEVCYKQSEGLFDLTSGVLRSVWDFKKGHLPRRDEVDLKLQLVGWNKLIWERPVLRFCVEGMELDLGGIGKEYAVDRVCGILIELGIGSALINLGGDIRVVGPQPDGGPWNIGVRHPRKEDQTIKIIPLKRGALASSGDYERYFESEGRRYCHILNPKTGYPEESLQSVSVLAESCLVAGAAATSAFLMGAELGLSYLNSLNTPYLVVNQAGELFESSLDLAAS